MNVWLLMYLFGARHELESKVFKSFVTKKPAWATLVETDKYVLTQLETYAWKSLGWLSIQWMAVPCLLDCACLGGRQQPMTPVER